MFGWKKRHVARVVWHPARTGWVTAAGSRTIEFDLGEDRVSGGYEAVRNLIKVYFDALPCGERAEPEHGLHRKGKGIFTLTLWYQRISQDVRLKLMLKQLAAERGWVFEDKRHTVLA